jgi:Kdo2-lipid IVA lauroyltransferase/acyltransferase
MRATSSRVRTPEDAVANMISRCGIFFMHVLGHLPLSWVRAAGWVLGWALYAVAVSRRKVVWTNLRLCFPGLDDLKLRELATQTFIYFSQAWLDRGWLWHGTPDVTRARLQLVGEVNELLGHDPVVIFSPHFVGLDAGWTALTQQVPRAFTTIYTHQANRAVDAWVLQGRKRFGDATLFDRSAGPKPILAALRDAKLLYLLPDMNYGLPESVFVPFYGVPAATVTSLSRLSKLGRAKVVPVVTRMTAKGYDVQVMPSWKDFPGPDVTLDALRMNQRLEAFINTMPSQYFWVHKRFKDRPAGAAPVY